MVSARVAMDDLFLFHCNGPKIEIFYKSAPVCVHCNACCTILPTGIEFSLCVTDITSDYSQKSTATKFGNLPRHCEQAVMRSHIKGSVFMIWMSSTGIILLTVPNTALSMLSAPRTVKWFIITSLLVLVPRFFLQLRSSAALFQLLNGVSNAYFHMYMSHGSSVLME